MYSPPLAAISQRRPAPSYNKNSLGWTNGARLSGCPNRIIMIFGSCAEFASSQITFAAISVREHADTIIKSIRGSESLARRDNDLMAQSYRSQPFKRGPHY